ncbi:MAG: biotin--[acetyl-CoA-carboxylase] ligase [Weeksellaceae bacterium]|nr:biotin--[acetyl-CoA-carboxylase] ligase [Weeksellaceae bacterium]
MPDPEILYHKHEVLDSTNQNLYHIGKDTTIDKIVVWTVKQTQGKGYMGNAWHADAAENITMSLLLRRPHIALHEMALINYYICTQVVNSLSKWHIEAKIKWPNDIVIENRKVGGLLVENRLMQGKIDYCVVGLGLNVYQKVFTGLPNAASIKLFMPNFDVEIDQMVKEIAQSVYAHVQDLKSENAGLLMSEYFTRLAYLKEWRKYKYRDSILVARLISINTRGDALFEFEDGPNLWLKHKEIEFLYK